MGKKRKSDFDETIDAMDRLRASRSGKDDKVKALAILATLGGNVSADAADTSEVVGRSTMSRYVMSQNGTLKGAARIAFDKTTSDTDTGLNQANVAIAQAIAEHLKRL